MDKKYKVIGIHIKKRTSGVYVFMNILKRRVYVGQTSDNSERFEQHLKAMFVNSNEGNGTNKKLKQDCETIEVEFFDVNNKSDLFDYETALMYVCRENGFKLYNGGDDDNDDTGRREKLISDDSNIKWEYCKKNIIYNEKNADENYEEIKEKFNTWFSDEYGINDGVANKNDEELECIWKERVDLFKTNENYYWVSSVGKINGSKTLTINDMEACGIQGIGIEELFKQYNTEYAMWSTFGLYIGQGPLTILKTKKHDIQNLELERLNECNDRDFIIKNNESERNDNGICFWSLKTYGLDFKRNRLACHENGKDLFREKRLLFLPYTSSNKTVNLDAVSLELEIREDEDLEEYFKRLKNMQKNDNNYFACGYKIEEKDGEKDFPENMFPEIVSKYTKTGRKKGNMAFLISEFYYLKDIDSKNIRSIKNSDCIMTVSDLGDDKPISDAYSAAPCHLVKIDSENLVDILKSKKSKKPDNDVAMLVAVLEYPYIVYIVNS